MFQVTPYEKKEMGIPIIDGKYSIKFRDGIYKFLLAMSKTKIKYKLVVDGNFSKIDGKPVIFAFNHTRFQDTPISCQIVDKVMNERAYMFIGKQKLGFDDNMFFYGYGSIFCNREDKDDKKVAQKAMEEYLKIGKSIIIFPEASWNLSDELLMHHIRWGSIKSAQKTGAQIIPSVMDYDTEKKECHVSFGNPIVVSENDDVKAVTDDLRDSMATLRYNYISNKHASRSDLDLEFESSKVDDILEEYPNYDYDMEQGCIFRPDDSFEEVFAPIKKLVPTKKNAFLFNKRNR